MTQEHQSTGVRRIVVAAILGGSVMWLSVLALPAGLLEVERPGSLSLLFVAMQAAEWPCAGSGLGDIDHRIFFAVLVVLGAAWLACMADLASRIAAKSGRAWTGIVIFVLALSLLLPIWPTTRLVCPSM
jgi:hypothetical protein